MSPSAFLDRESPPGPKELGAMLGRALPLWAELRSRLGGSFAPMREKWSYAGKSHGWSLQLRQGKRTVLYLIPGPGRFVASMALSEKGCEAAEGSDLPGAARALIREAPRYPEGRGVRLEVRGRRDLPLVERMAALRMAH